MATTADFRNGLCIVFKDDLYTIVQFQHVKPGKGPAFVRTKLRNVKTGRILENTFTSGVKIDTARIERRPYQFLYKEGEDYVMMHTETFEQVNIPEELINAPQFLKEGDANGCTCRYRNSVVCRVDAECRVGSDLYRTGPERRYRFIYRTETGRSGNRRQSNGSPVH
jgi:translation elongation factor P/translation initiation factor 5A